MLHYSPRNWLVVPWPFPLCGLPDPLPRREQEERTPACREQPIVVYPDTYDWARFLPEVMVGMEDADPDIAANYTRQAAIEFARSTHVLQRDLVLDLERGENEYHLTSFPGERIAGVLNVRLDEQDCGCSGALEGRTELGFSWRFDNARNTVTFDGQPQHGRLQMRLWAVPTEDACAYDVFLYDNFRAAITIGARRFYALANHFRDRALIASLPPETAWDRAILAALRQAHQVPSARKAAVSSTWASSRRRF